MPRCTKCGRWRLFSSQLNNGLCEDCLANAHDAKMVDTVPIPPPSTVCENQEPPIPDEEKQFYQPDDYYTETDLAGNSVVPFEQRKSGWKSKNGLYPAEILLLYYCSKGQYPRPAKGYPAFWWFEYGIRNVSYILGTLENRGFIRYGSLADSAGAFTAAQLKQLLKDAGVPATGKKEELVERAKMTVSDDALLAAGLCPKYQLTELGAEELEENKGVVSLHNSPEKTTSDSRYGPTFNLESVASQIEDSPTMSWEEAIEVSMAARKNFLATKKSRDRALLQEIKKRDPGFYQEISRINRENSVVDRELEKLQVAEEAYKATRNLERYVEFWEDIWKHGGLHFSGSTWAFKLPDLYFKQKRYDDVITFCNMLKGRDEFYSVKADKYIQRAQERKEKQKKNV